MAGSVHHESPSQTGDGPPVAVVDALDLEDRDTVLRTVQNYSGGTSLYINLPLYCCQSLNIDVGDQMVIKQVGDGVYIHPLGEDES